MALDLKRPITQLNNEEKQALANVLAYCAEQLPQLQLQEAGTPANEDAEKRISALEAENQNLNKRLEDAKAYFRENKNAVENAEGRTKNLLAKNLQQTRDEIYSLGNALHEYAKALGEKPKSVMTLVQVNNLQAGLEAIIQNLTENGLWKEDSDLKPDLTQVVVEEKPKKKKSTGTRKKKAEGEVALAETSAAKESLVGSGDTAEDTLLHNGEETLNP